MPAADNTMTLNIVSVIVAPMIRMMPCSRFSASSKLDTSRSCRSGSTAALTSLSVLANVDGAPPRTRTDSIGGYISPGAAAW